jgi:hypothetical protein
VGTESVRLLDVQPGDVLVLKTAGMDAEGSEAIAELRGQLPEGVRLLVLDPEAEVDVVRAVDAQ